jgi:sugar/nucleoside kinase (ribokinase family)
VRKTWDVIGVGANSVDYVLILPEQLPSLARSAKIRVQAQSVRCGGQTATTLGACAALGLTTKYIGAIGRDAEGQRMRDALDRRAVNVTHLIERDAPTQTATILVHPGSALRVVLSNRDSRLSLSAADVPAESMTMARVVHVDDVDMAAALEAATMARASGVPVTSDIDQISDRTEELVASVTYPIFAEEVPPLLTGCRDPEAGLRALRRHHAGVLCVTLGERGVMALEGDNLYHQPAFSVEVRDTTGAGDVFRGAFIYGLLRGWKVPEILEFSAAAAAVSCTRIGAFDGIPTLEDIEGLLQRSGQGAVGSGQ